jgi:hypothetical protein
MGVEVGGTVEVDGGTIEDAGGEPDEEEEAIDLDDVSHYGSDTM